MMRDTLRLLHDSEGTPGATPRVLLLAYHFPPSTAVGALRWERLVHLLAADGIRFDVITRPVEDLYHHDLTALRHLPSGTRVFAVSHRESLVMFAVYRAVRIVKSLRRMLSGEANSPQSSMKTDSATERTTQGPESTTPTKRGPGELFRVSVTSLMRVLFERTWSKAAYDAAVHLSKDTSYRVVIASSPPHFIQVDARRIARRLQLPLCLDFRDPWALSENLPPELDTAIFRRLSQFHERRAIAQSTAVFMNTEAAVAAMQERYPRFADRFYCVMNGSDPQDRRESPERTVFTVLYAGTLYLQRDPRVIFSACATVIHQRRIPASDFRLVFMGDVERYNGMKVIEIAREYGLEEYVEILGHVPRNEVLTMAASAALLVCLPDGQRLSVPAKLFEYSQLDSWVLAFADQDSAMARALQGTSAFVMSAQDAPSAQKIVEECWERFSRGERPTAIGADGRFLRSTQARRMSEILSPMLR